MHQTHAKILRGIFFYLTIQEFRKIKTIKYTNFEIKFDAYDIKYTKPSISPKICIKKNKTYLTNLYIPVEINYKKIKILN